MERMQVNVLKSRIGERGVFRGGSPILALAPEIEAAALLRSIACALKPGGSLVLDVTTPVYRRERQREPTWSVHPGGGFWRAGPYFLLRNSHAYPDLALVVEQYAVIEEDGTAAVYRNWLRDYDLESISPVFGSSITDAPL